MSLRDAAQQALEALELARINHDVMLMSDPPQDAWKARGVSCKIASATNALRAALADTQDWDEVEALRASLREHMSEIHRLRAAGRQAIDALYAIRDGATGLWGDDLFRCNNALDHLTNDFADQSVTDCHEKGGDKLASPSDHIPDATKMIEPVAYVTGFSKGYAVVQPVDRCLLMCVGMALYRSPPKRKPLTDEKIEDLYFDCFSMGELKAFARAIERAHGIGGEE